MDNPTGHISPAEVRALIAAQFPGEPNIHIQPVAEGGDYATFLLDDRTIFRFPRDCRANDKLLREARLLPSLAPMLPLPIPTVTHVGQPSATYPYNFAGYTRLAGVSGEVLRPNSVHWPVLAAALGHFFAHLHAVPSAQAQEQSVPMMPAADPLLALHKLAAYQEILLRDAGDILTARMRRYLAGSIAVPEAGLVAPVLCHGDLKGEHILLAPDGRTITGILDWSDLCLADPAFDFAGLFIWLGGEFVERVLHHYGGTRDTLLWARARYWAQVNALFNLGERLASASDSPLDLLRTQLRWAFADDEP